MNSALKLNSAAVVIGILGLGATAYAIAQRERSAGPLPPPPLPPPPPNPYADFYPPGQVPEVLLLPPPAPAAIPSHPVSVVTNAPPPSSAVRAHATAVAKPAPKKPAPAAPSPLDYARATIETAPASAAQQAELIKSGRAIPELLREPAAAPAPPKPQRAPSKAANELFSYVTSLLRTGGPGLSHLGTADAPSDFIAAAQRDMRGIASDGIYGPKTAARGKELLGKEFPKRAAAPKPAVTWNPGTPQETTTPPAGTTLEAPPPPPPSVRVNEHAPQEAAAALFELVTAPPVNWGTKAKPNPLIKAAQADMGGIAADGVYGPKTAARGTRLLNRTFPART